MGRPRPGTTRRWLLAGAVGSAVFVATALLPAPEEVRVAPFDRYGEAIAGGSIPYRSFSLEYPPGALPPIVLPALVPTLSYESAFRILEILLGVLLVLCTAHLLRGARTVEVVVGVGVVAALPVLLGSVVVHRFDLFPAVLLSASLVALERGKEELSGALIGLAAAAKAYAGAVLPPFLGKASDEGWDVARRSLAFAAGAAALVTLPLAVVAPGGVASSVLRQTGRELQLESVGASLLLALGERPIEFVDGSWSVFGTAAEAVALVSSLAGLVVLVAIWAATLRYRDRLGAPALAYAAAVAVVLVFAKVLSPQYLVWLVPLVALVRGKLGLAACVLSAIACVLTRSVYPPRYEELVAQETLPIGLLLARNVVLLAVAAVLVIGLARRLRAPGVGE